MKALIFFLSACWSVTLWGQTGNYFLSHYAPDEKRLDNLCFDITQDKKGVMYFATKAGILGFDGRDWDLLPATAAVYAVQIDPSTGEMYWCGAKGFGKISLDDHGAPQMISLSDASVVNVFQALILNDQVYFLTQDAIYIFYPATRKTIIIRPQAKENIFLKLFELSGAVYVSTDNKTFKIHAHKLTPAGLALNREVIFSSRIDDHYIIGTGDNKIYTCGKDLSLRQVSLKDQRYIDASVVVNGIWLNRQLLALGTLRGGVIFINPINGATQEIINYTTGLPDNEVFQIMTDATQNIWVAHDYGFTKISPGMPLRSFSYYPGMEGNLLCVLSLPKAVYVGTSLGLFKLEQVEVYAHTDNTEQPKTTKGKAATSGGYQQSAGKSKTQHESKKGGLLSFLKRDRDPIDRMKENQRPKTYSHNSSDRRRQGSNASEEKAEKVLPASRYVFKKVKDIDAKVTHLASVADKIFASGLGGLYEVTDLQAKLIQNEPIRYMYSPANSDVLIISNYADEVRSLHFKGNMIENASVFSHPGDQIHYVFEGDNELWFCGFGRLYRAEVKNDDIRHKQTIELPQPNNDRTVGLMLNNDVILANPEGFYHFKRQTNTIIKLDTLPKPSQYFAYNGGIVYRDGHGWNFMGTEVQVSSLQLLNVFNDLKFIASDQQSQNLWIISGGNALYKFFGDKYSPSIQEYPVFLKSIFNQEEKVTRLTGIDINQEQSAIKFHVSQPDYTSPRAVEYRYYLDGMQEKWSEWSTNNNIISFPYLPAGEYTLRVEARNIFGKINVLEPVSFKVRPPYWKRSWFYALEFLVFASLVMLSFRLSTRYRFISRLLSLLTIILLIEFIQTAIGSTVSSEESPVVEFLIQVIVALLVLPVEGFLRNLMLRSLDSSGKFYQFIVPDARPSLDEKSDLIIGDNVSKIKQISDTE